jgi:hypothetical protein
MTKNNLIVKSIVFLVVTSFFITFALIGCSTHVAGTYISEINNKNYIELKADGSFFMRDGNIHGEYEMKGDEITLIWGGRFSTGWIKENILVASDGNKWVKS